MEFLTTLLATFAGAALAFGSDLLVRHREARRREEAAVNNLLIDLAAKRAFAPDVNIAWTKGVRETVLDSVNHTRTVIRDTRLQLRPRSPYLDPLRLMVRACATFLEQTEHHRRPSVAVELDALTTALRAQVETIQALDPKNTVTDLPGDFALDGPIDRDRTRSRRVALRR